MLVCVIDYTINDGRDNPTGYRLFTTLTAVSYTHLDVYKRQVGSRGRPGRQDPVGDRSAHARDHAGPHPLNQRNPLNQPTGSTPAPLELSLIHI